VGAGRTGGGLDASNMLKPALAKGLLQCIGATTLKDFKQYIESDKALERRFQIVKIEAPSVEQTVQILQGLKDRYQHHHQIEYADSAIESAAALADKYIQQRFLPDKAIDLLDEAGAAKRIKKIYLPPEIRNLENEKRVLEGKKLQAFSVQNFEAMAKYQMDISLLDEKLAEFRRGNTQKVDEAELKVNEQDIAQIVSNMTGIPAQRMVAAEANKLMTLEASLQKRVIGQGHALSAVANAIKRNRSGLRSPNKPIASFLFLGPTGVGKTELAKALAALVLDDESKIIRLDMSEYMERHNVSKLIGSPPGYVGYGEGGQLTERVKRQPYSIILLDEFEKAHPDVYNVLLPVLDEGWLTDAEGEKVSFRNTMIIGTSNIGSHILSERKATVGIGAQTAAPDRAEEHAEVMKELKKYLRPEFLNRLDEVIIFNRLGLTELQQIIGIYMDDLTKRVKKLGMTISIDEKVPDYILQTLHNFHFGARPLKRQMETLIENKVATLLIEQSNKKGTQIKVGIDAKGEINVTAN
jgi:ATP-dependent Clp protease ATP-binding subunit ClpC